MTEHTVCRQGAAGTQSSMDPLSVALGSVADGGQSPPSLHDAQTIIADIKLRLSCGPSGENWKEYRLAGQEWANLKDLLTELKLERKVLYHYFSRSQTFVHQMPTTLHAILSRSFSRLLLNDPVIVCGGAQESERFKEEILDFGDGDMEGRTGSDIHQPDGFFRHKMGGAGVVFEFAYSQKTQKLRELAQFYLLESGIKVELVVGMDYDYANHTKKTTLLTWKRDESDSAGDVKLREYVQELRSEDGTPIPGPDLQITMFDLAPRDRIPLSLRHAAINLSVNDLCKVIQDAEEAQEYLHQELRSSKNMVRGTGNSAPTAPN